MRIQIQYFAMLAERRGLTEEHVTIATPDLGALYDALASLHGFPLSRAAVRPAVNDVFRPWNHPLQDGDRVVFVPPVTGG